LKYYKKHPEITPFTSPEHIKDYPKGPCFHSGHLVETNSGWRTYRPIIDLEKCINCLMCYLYCPDGTIFKKDGKVAVNYDFCKGCGICAKECKKDAISMVKEDIFDEK